MSLADAVPLLQWDVDDDLNCACLSHDGSRVSSGSGKFFNSEVHLIHIWDIHTGALVVGALPGHTHCIWSVAWSHDDSLIVSASHDHTIRIWDTHTGVPIGGPLTGHTSHVFSAMFSSDDSRIVSCSADLTVRIWDVRTGAVIGDPLTGHTKWVHSVAFSPDSTRIVSSSDDCTIRMWGALTGAPIGDPLREHTRGVNCVAFSPDSSRIVSCSDDDTIRIWDARTGASIGEPLRGHSHWVFSVTFSPDGRHIVSSSRDGSIRFWDAYTGAPIGEPLTRSTGVVRSVSFTPDCTRIVYGSVKSIYVWRTPCTAHLSHGEAIDIDTPMVDVIPGEIVGASSLALTHEQLSGAMSQSLPLSDGHLDAIIAPSFDMVTSEMSVREMFECLVRHGCSDLTSLLDMSRSSAVITSGGLGDIQRLVVDTNTVVAVKTLRLHVLLKDDDKAFKRSMREVYVWSRLRHVNVQELLGIIVFQDGLGMVTAWREQGNLQQYIEGHPQVARHPLCVQVASGVSYLHSIGMVHGDLKATNVLVTDDGTLKISEFDYAIVPETSLRFSATTRPGGGTLRWMAPELLQPERLGDEDSQHPTMRSTKTDVYALGMTMLEIATGDVPYAEYKNDMGIYRAIHTQQPPDRPKELPVADTRSQCMWELLMRCWDHDPSVRPEASVVLAELNSLAA